MVTKSKTDYFITLEEAKVHLRVDSDFTDENEYIQNLIYGATNIAENFIEADIATTTNTVVFNDFSGDSFVIPEAHFRSITSVIDADSNEYTVDELRIYDDRFTVELTESIGESDLTVVFETGYIETTLPYSIRQAILVKIADLYDIGRTGYSTSGIHYNELFEALLYYYKIPRFKYYKTN